MIGGIVSFNTCFDALQASLASVVSGNAAVSHSTKSELKDISRSQRKLEGAIRSEVRKGLGRAVSARIASLRKQRDAALLRMRTDAESRRTDVAAMETYKKKEMEGCLTQKLMSERRLTQQLLSAERRIRELVFEIIGEYGKSDVRFRRRQAYLAYNARIQVAWASHKCRWEHFALRLCYEATRSPPSHAAVVATGSKNSGTGAIQPPSTQQQRQFDALRGTLLDNVKDASEISWLERRIWQKLYKSKSSNSNLRQDEEEENDSEGPTEQSVRCLSVLRILKTKTTSGPGGNAPASSFRTLVPMSVLEVGDFQRVRSALRMWALQPVRAAANQTSKDGRPQLSKSGSTGGRAQATRSLSRNHASAASDDLHEEDQVLPAFLRSRCVEWLHPPSHCPHIWDDLVETRRCSQQADRTATAALEEKDEEEAHDDGEKKLTPALDCFIERFGVQRSAFVASERLYYCLEERQVTRPALTPEGNSDEPSRAFADMLSRIEHHYVDDADAGLLPLREQLEQVPLEVQSYLGTHRDIAVPSDTHEDVANLASMYPDIVSTKPVGSSSFSKAGSTTLHFVPATTYNLLETQAFAEVSTNVSPRPSEIRDIVRRGAYPRCAIEPPLAGDDEPINNNMTAAEVDASKRFALNLTKPQPLGRLYIAIRMSVTDHRAETAKPIGKEKRVGRAKGKGKRNARNRHVALAKRKASSSSANDSTPRVDDQSEPLDGDDEEDDDDADADVDAEGNDGSADRDPTTNAASDDKTQLVILPLSDLCMYEAVCAEFWPNASLADMKLAQKDELYEATEDVTEASLRAPSCINLLPDHARLHLQPRKGADSGEQLTAQKLQHEYMLVGDEYSDVPETEQSSSTASRASTAKPCYYFVQLERKQGGVDTQSLSPYGSVSELHASDDLQHRRILLDRRNTGRALSSEKVDGGNRGLERKVSRDCEDSFKEKDKGKRKWDTAILSSVCRWRSCLAECTAHSTPKYLCAYHTSLYAFLEGTVKGGSGEAAKYLPKKVPLLMSSSTLSDSKKDLLMIRAASTLLQELWDGKLRATVRSFTKKVAHDMGLRRRLESSLNLTSTSWQPKDDKTGKKSKEKEKEKESKQRGSRTSRGSGLEDSSHKSLSSVEIEQSLNVPSLPSWTHWKDEDSLHRATNGQGTCMANLDTILDLETTISSELRRLMDMHVFPAQELSLIKKEVKAFKDAFEGAIAHDAKKEYSTVFYEATAAQGSKSSTAKAAEEYAAMIAAESKVCEKKLHILRVRRGEEQDARQVQARRVARARAVEDSQAKDPANFSQQR